MGRSYLTDPDARVHQRDHSFYARSHGGSAGKYHFMGRDLASRCGHAQLLLTSESQRAADVDERLRCRARGRRELWPAEQPRSPTS